MIKPLGQGFHPQSFRPCVNAVDRAFRPQKSLGQHFLRSKQVLNRILAAADLKKSDRVLEVGPGQGVLTRELAKKAGRVIAVEKDPRLIPVLQTSLKEFNNVEIIEGDILKLLPQISNFKFLISKQVPKPKFKISNNYKLVANLPYYAATHIVRKFLEAKSPPRLMVLMLQKEVAQRICAKPPKMSLLGISIQFFAEAKIVGYVSKTAFWPCPKVDSAIIKLRTKNYKLKTDRDLFFKIVRAGFAQPRKQLANNLSKELELSKEKTGIWLAKNGLGVERRAQDLGVDGWLALAKTFASML